MQVRKHRKRLLFVVNLDLYFVLHRLPIADAAVRSGYETHIAANMTDQTKILERRGLIVHPLKFDRSSQGLYSNVTAFFEFYRLFKAIKPDIVHLITIKPVIFGGIAARLTRVPAVVSAIPGLGFVFVSRGILAMGRRWIVAWLYRLAFKHRRLRVIFENSSDQNILLKIAKLHVENSVVVPGVGVDTAHYRPRPLPSSMPVAMMASRLLVDKGVREFAQAARCLRESARVAKNARFVLVGELDADNPASLGANELKQWTSRGWLEYWGHSNAMPKVLAAAHVVILPSFYGEGLPRVLCEAAACGRAVITTDHPGCRDAIEPDVSGLLVPVRDAHALANTIEQLLNDPVRCATMGRAGRVLAVRTFDVHRIMSMHTEIYHQLLTETE